MDEYISREAVLNLIEHNDKVCHYADERYENVVYATTQTICKVVAEMPAADVQPIDRWISVNDKLPEQDEKVLVLTKDKDIMTMIYKVIPFRWYKPKFGGFDKDYVTHWKPLKDGDTE